MLPQVVLTQNTSGQRFLSAWCRCQFTGCMLLQHNTHIWTSRCAALILSHGHNALLALKQTPLVHCSFLVLFIYTYFMLPWSSLELGILEAATFSDLSYLLRLLDIRNEQHCICSSLTHVWYSQKWKSVAKATACSASYPEEFHWFIIDASLIFLRLVPTRSWSLRWLVDIPELCILAPQGMG